MTFLLDQDVPNDIIYSLGALGHRVVLLREGLTAISTDQQVLAYAHQHQFILITCNRDDFLQLAKSQPYHGIIILIRRKTRVAERAALIRLLDRTDESGLINNINFA